MAKTATYIIRPLVWTKPVRGRLEGGAWCTHDRDRCIRDIGAELVRIGVNEFILELDVQPSHIKIDGRLNAQARLGSYRCGISFVRGNRPMKMQSDRYSTLQANLRAIVLTLNALRGVERWGVAQAGEQYTGFAALPPAQGFSGGVPEATEWLRREYEAVMGRSDDRDLNDSAHRRIVFRTLAAKFHPDNRSTGDSSQFIKLNNAMKVIAPDQ